VAALLVLFAALQLQTAGCTAANVADSLTTPDLGWEPPSASVVVGGVRVAPGSDIQGFVNAHPAGTVFILGAGMHRNQKVVSKDGNVFVGEPGAILDGGNTVDAAFNGGGKDVTIQGLVIQNYNNPAESSAVNAGPGGWRVIGNEVRYNAGAGIGFGGSNTVIEDNYVHHNEQIGILSWKSSDSKVINNEIAHNNPNDKYEYAWEAGGTKFLLTTNLYVAGNYVHDNHGPGLWTDANNYKTVYENNTVRDNYGPGIFHEISYDAVIRNNTVTGNAHRFYLGGILVANASNVEVFGNTLEGNDGGIVGLQDDRGSGNRGVFQTTNFNVHHNTVTWNQGIHGIHYNSGVRITETGTIRFDNNTYTTSHNNPFKWGTTTHTWQQWQNLGQDPNSTFN
jgi:parallel beta-helix repeat protein